MLKILFMKLSLIHALISGHWLMDERAAFAYEPFVQRLINGEEVKFQNFRASESDEAIQLNHSVKAVMLTSQIVDPSWQDLNKAPKGSIAVIPLQGVVMKQDFCGDPGLDTLQSWMQAADNNPNIIGQVMYIDSPGGNSMGVDGFSKFVRNLNKPVVSYVETMACSAGYWIASSTREIILAEALTETGSIGAFSTFIDKSKQQEMQGVRRIEVYAPQSTMKNKRGRDVIAGEIADYQERFLKPLVENFQATVKKNRRGKTSLMPPAVMAGDVFNGTESVAYGLADRIGSFKSALQSVTDLSNKKAA
jgi:ClpP class serine protease